MEKEAIFGNPIQGGHNGTAERVWLFLYTDTRRKVNWTILSATNQAWGISIMENFRYRLQSVRLSAGGFAGIRQGVTKQEDRAIKPVLFPFLVFGDK